MRDKSKKRGISPALWFLMGVAVGLLAAPPRTMHFNFGTNENHHYHWDDTMPEGEVVEVDS